MVFDSMGTERLSCQSEIEPDPRGYLWFSFPESPPRLLITARRSEMWKSCASSSKQNCLDWEKVCNDYGGSITN